MAKPDWGELQKRFLSEHANSGVSPKDWCEAQGLNYATARRYIKKPPAQSAQKLAQKKVRIVQKDKCTEELVDDDGLTAQQRLFVAEYLKDNNATRAAIRAGYSKKSAEQIGYQLLQKTSVAQAIAQQQKASIVRTLGSADEVTESQAPGFRSYDINDQENLAVGYRAEGVVNVDLLGYSWDNWVNVPRSSTTSFDVPGIYAGRYLVRVRAINAAEISSGWGYSEEKTLTGKVGNPPKPVGFIASENVVFGIELNWGFPANTDDTLKTEIQYSLTGTEDDAMLLADVPYPQRKYQQMGLKAGQIFWYRAQLVDRNGNESGYTEWVRGQASIDVSDITDAILEDMKGSETFKDLIENAVDSNEKIAGMADDIKQANDELEQHAKDIAKNAQDVGKVQTSVNELSSTVGEVSSSLSELEQTVATADTALGQRIDSISVSMDGMTGGVKNSAIAIIQANLAQVATRKTLSASVAGNSANLDRIDKVIVTDREATARSLLSLQTDVNGNKASINSLNQTFSDYQQATATQINSITATVNGHTAAITTNAQAIANVNGDLEAMYSIKVGLSSNGQYYAAGMGIGVENTPSGMQSQVIFLADRFAVTHQAGATVTLPFVIQNGQTFIRNTVIGEGTIDNTKIGSYIQSTTWDGTGNVGWHINKSGYATFNNVTVRGSIYATNGNFSFNGSGNTTVINGNGVTINIPGGGRIVLGTWS
ncbi:major capsid protein [Enterobacter ludwigii]|nr:major capsid protein [Enterobacter ludwigii]MDW5474757.1 major capsid protein [Enterobacter ludwigii]